ncbi:type VII secretion protein EccCa [Nesterenkonia sp. MY13]|uniref:Type VII secretion protein EccCa n=1 Tax=Nesterenkonia sedimenti TaxID=1463632 RepID=A0A7X8TK26_9MICC|nr:type VII secretion protein EccCa [Nesterenkonia sedimenti]NLS09989.1 type VII secretion protein EccCa [Nesterenkonia sedimenti]
MTLKLVHRPTRTTAPVPQAAPTMLAAPPELEGNSGAMPMQMILPIIGALSSVTMMVVLRHGNPLFMMMAGVIFLVAIVGGIGYALSSRGRQAKQQRQQRELYLDYLEETRADLQNQMSEVQAQALSLHPHPSHLVSVIQNPERFWERRRTDADFLQARLGTGRVTHQPMSIPPEESPTHPQDPFLKREAELVAETSGQVEAMPIQAALRETGTVAIIGDHLQGVELARSMLLQLATFHSPDDIIFAGIWAPERAQHWRGVDLLPHIQDAAVYDGPVPARRVAPSMQEVAALLRNELTQRMAAYQQARRNGLHQAHTSRLIVVVDDHGRYATPLPLPEGVTDLFGLNITVVYLLSEQRQEPRNVDMRITLEEASAVLTTRASSAEPQRITFQPDPLSTDTFTAAARTMSGYRLRPDIRDEMETTSSFDVTDLLGFSSVNDVAPDRLWKPRTSGDFLKVPFGVDDAGNPVDLDLKENAQGGMGPHGICIGATGSGKSEMLRTLILSLVMRHSPQDLSLVLVDYKGGAAFAPFAPLPHVAGLIDNLEDDAQLTARARTSIQGEVVRRQKMLKDAGSLASITQYRTMREQDPEMEPMPHLFLVIDEFGELLTAEPDFAELFLQIGRIGRSIGVHLLLSSQRLEAGKLKGLDTYLSYRVGLRTFSESESRMVLDSRDAFHLPALPGYGYLKVDTSLYTRFRAGYVSGPVPAEQQIQATDDARPLPRLLPAYNGLSAAEREEVADESFDPTPHAETAPELIDEVIFRLTDEDKRVRPVWLPPLPEQLALGSLIDSSQQGGRGLQLVLGLEDDPEHQQQRPWTMDLGSIAGHAAVVGGPRSGRSTLLRTVALSLALTRTPSQCAIYGMDLTGGALQRLEGFPHVGGVATRSDPDRLGRLIDEIQMMLNQRESVFRRYGIDSLGELRHRHSTGEITELTSAEVMVLVDGYGQLGQDFDRLKDRFNTIMHRGASFGVHMVLGLTRWNELRASEQALFGWKAELKLNDETESTVDKKLMKTISADTPGRVLLTNKNFAHTALPVLDIADAENVGDTLRQLGEEATRSWSGPRAAPIRLLPTVLSPAELPDVFTEPDAVPLGIRQDTMSTAFWDFMDRDQHLIVLGDSKSGKTSLLRHITAQLVERFDEDELVFAVFDSRGQLAAGLPEEYVGNHARNPKQGQALAKSVSGELDQRPERSPQEFADSPRIVVLVDDYDIFSAGGGSPLQALVPHLPSARDLKLHVVLARPVAGSSRAFFDPIVQVSKDTGGAVLVMDGDRGEGQILPKVYPENFPPGRGRFVRRGEKPHIIQTAWDKAEEQDEEE